ncbi:UNVERIFIED_CONTAM: hypothetical protein GTU68_007975 [Idotea baltica]|nr:hypothetical protein [Idotea baltica]
MGVGKSTIAQKLAEQERLKYFDVDMSIQERTRMDIRDIFARYGETLFREIETNALMATSNYDNVIVATGGGLPCFNRNIDWMKSQGTVVYLKMAPPQLHERLVSERHKRPLIASKTEGELKKYITDHLGTRKPFYEQADYVIDASQSIENVCTEIRKIIKVKEPAL